MSGEKKDNGGKGFSARQEHQGKAPKNFLKHYL